MVSDSASSLARMLEARSAEDMTRFADALAGRGRRAVVDPPRSVATSFPLAGGHVVLTGPDLYVNAALGAGIERPPTDAELDRLIEAATERGLIPAFEVSELSHVETVDALAGRGFGPDVESEATAGLVFDLDVRPASESGHATQAPGGRIEQGATATAIDVRVEPVTAVDELARWQEATAVGWGHDTASRRRASDDFAAAAHATQSPGLLLAIDSGDPDRSAVGAAGLSITAGFAVLGAMSTVPAYRNRGVQRRLIEWRLDAAKAAGCVAAGTHARFDSASMRNLGRAGFVHTHTVQTWITA